MNSTESIIEIKKVISSDFINKIIPLINKKAKKNMMVRSSDNKDTLLKNFRNVKGYSLCNSTPTDFFYFSFIKKEIERLYTFYKVKFPKMKSSRVDQIELLKYTTGGKYDVHVDQYTNAPRHLSVILNLNDDYEGGDLIFTDQKNKEIKRLKLSKGSIVFFPSNFMYPHGIEPITKGIRYSIVSWLN